MCLLCGLVSALAWHLTKKVDGLGRSTSPRPSLHMVPQLAETFVGGGDAHQAHARMFDVDDDVERNRHNARQPHRMEPAACRAPRRVVPARSAAISAADEMPSGVEACRGAGEREGEKQAEQTERRAFDRAEPRGVSPPDPSRAGACRAGGPVRVTAACSQRDRGRRSAPTFPGSPHLRSRITSPRIELRDTRPRSLARCPDGRDLQSIRGPRGS